MLPEAFADAVDVTGSRVRVTRAVDDRVAFAVATLPLGMKRAVAVKFGIGPHATALISNEARVLLRIAHRCVGTLLALHVTEFAKPGRAVPPFLMLPWWEGAPLSALLASREALSHDAGVYLGHELFDALCALQAARDPMSGEFSPIVHGAIAAENVFVCRDGSVKLHGFSAARVVGRVEGGERGPSIERDVRTDLRATAALLGAIVPRAPHVPGDVGLSPTLDRALARAQAAELDAYVPRAREFVERLRNEPGYARGRAALAHFVERCLTRADASTAQARNLQARNPQAPNPQAPNPGASVPQAHLDTLARSESAQELRVTTPYFELHSDHLAQTLSQVVPAPSPPPQHDSPRSAPPSFRATPPPFARTLPPPDLTAAPPAPQAASRTLRASILALGAAGLLAGSLTAFTVSSHRGRPPSFTSTRPAASGAADVSTRTRRAAGTQAEPRVTRKLLDVGPPPSSADRTGLISTDPSERGHRVFVDGRVLGEGGSVLSAPCGMRRIQVGSGATLRRVVIPCGGEVHVTR
jgi:hypothetical protein